MTEITGISISKQQKKPVIINFLGSFSIQADDKEIDDNCNRSQKMWSLLEYLIFYHKKNISHQQLID
ncbi:MAG: SARP family transcriptional regulator, partial [Clostridiales bacterium]